MKFRNRYSDFGIGASLSSLNDRGRRGGTQNLRLDTPLTRLLYYEDKEEELEVIDFNNDGGKLLFEQTKNLFTRNQLNQVY